MSAVAHTSWVDGGAAPAHAERESESEREREREGERERAEEKKRADDVLVFKNSECHVKLAV